MKKIIVGFIFLFLSLFVSLPAKAQTTTKPAMQWHCLEATRVAGHTVDLTTKPGDLPTAKAKTYVVVCITTEQGNVCTTGDSTLDGQTLGYNGMNMLNQSTATGGYEQQGLTFNGADVPKDKIVANAQGKLTAPMPTTSTIVEPLRWTDYSPKSVGRKWLALNLISTINYDTGTGGQQQGTFTFEGALSRCVAIAWDPYGIVFDSQSLEPIAGVKVSLLKQAVTGGYSLAVGEEFGSILNPAYTAEDGAFSFYVPDGTYKMDVLANNFTFPNVVNKLNANYSKIYSDIYRGEDIIQKGAIQHRDIPLDSKGAPYTAPVKLMSYFPMLDKGANIFIIQGRVSHPLTTINVYGKKPNTTNKEIFVRTKLLLSTKATKNGQFELKIDLSKLQPTEMVGDIELIKPNYNSLAAVGAAGKPTIFTVEPIPNYLEGYAYGPSGQALPKATVGVYLNFSNKPAYEVQTDDNGYFVVPSEYLPAMTYGVKYTAATGAAPYSVTTSQFIAENAEYIATHSGNMLYTYKNKKGEVIDFVKRDKLTAAASANKANSINNQPTLAPVTNAASAIAANPLMAIVLIIVLLAVVAIIIIIVLAKKRSTSPPPPMPPPVV